MMTLTQTDHLSRKHRRTQRLARRTNSYRGSVRVSGLFTG